LNEPACLNLRFEIDREEDGRWIADILDLPGTQVYGESRERALAAAKALALRVLADRLESGELRAEDFADVHFVPNAA
jgi:predicted RNase H-like HicB family nuclease